MITQGRGTVIILANGQLESPRIIKDRLTTLESFSVVAADGGSAHAEKLSLRVDTVIGDLDSFDPTHRTEWESAGTTFIEHPPHKDETDLELALLYAVNRFNAQRIIVLGALGDRLDMTLANIMLLELDALRDRQAELWHGQQTARLLRPPGDLFNGSPGDTLSLIPQNGPAENITTAGLEYPLKGETLFSGPARGISNVFTEESVQVKFSAGLLLAVHTPGRA